MLSKSIDKYLEANGWSSHLFLNHAAALFSDKDLLRRSTLEVGRSVVYMRSSGKMIKFYVHHNGRSKEFLTLTSSEGKELQTFHHTASVAEIKKFILDYFTA